MTDAAANRSTTRRGMLRIAGSSVAAVGFASILRPDAASAASGTLIYGSANDAGAASTSLTSSHTYETIRFENTAGERAIYAVTVGAGPAPVVTVQTASVTHTGVALYSEDNGSGGAIYGRAHGAGSGVRGSGAGSGVGVQGDDAGTGAGSGVAAFVFNASNDSPALDAATNGTGPAAKVTGSLALAADGAVTFTRSGVALVAHPARSVDVTVPGRLLDGDSLCLAVVRSSATARWVVSAAPIVGTSTLRITLNRAPGSARVPSTSEIAWFVIG